MVLQRHCIVILAVIFMLLSVLYMRYGTEHFATENKKPRIALITLMRAPIELPFWLEYYRDMGVTSFHVRLEDSPNWEKYLKQQADVVTLEIGKSQPDTSNYHSLMERQKAFVNKVIAKCNRDDSADFVFHIDQDELLKGTFDFIPELSSDIKTLHLENAEAVYDPTTQNSACFEANRYARCSQGDRCRSYANGKAGGRAEQGVAFAGPHNFSYNGQIDGSFKHEVPFEKLHVLHFDSCTLGAFVDKFHHISRNVNLADIPFGDYPKNIEVARTAYDAYKRTAME